MLTSRLGKHGTRIPFAWRVRIGILVDMRRIAAFLAGVLVMAGPVLAAENWPQFRGSDQGRSDAKNLPVKWSEKENIKWQTGVHGKAWSSPVVFGDQIWMTSATEDG